MALAFDVQGYLKSLDRFGIKPGLERIRALLDRLGNPEAAFPAVHIGGTNGKGSTAAVTASILRQAGYRVGLYTSPHLIHYNERIQVDGRPIADDELQALFAEVVAAAGDVKKEIGSDLTEFEVGTAAAFLHFQHTGVEVAVVEVGLGGRLDSTNVVDAKGVAIGPISLDHVSLLGASLGSIAKEKAGIFRPGVPAVIAPQHPEAGKVIAKAAAALPTPLVWVRETAWSPGRESVADWLDSLREEPDSQGSTTVFYGVIEWGPQGGRFHLRTPRGVYRELQTPLLGLHQVQNAAVAVTLVETLRDRGFAVDEAQIREGLLSARWPGRLELVPGAPKILLDGVHNQGGAQAFARAFARIFGDARPVFVVALTGEKDPKEVLGPLAPFASHMVTTRPRSSRVPAVDPDTLAACASALGLPATSCQNAGEALERAAALAGEDGMVCVCGSLYLVGEVRGLLLLEESR